MEKEGRKEKRKQLREDGRIQMEGLDKQRRRGGERKIAKEEERKEKRR